MTLKKKWRVLGVGFLLVFLFSCRGNHAKNLSYTFAGSNDQIEVTGGKWSLEDGKELFDGGSLTYKIPEPRDVVRQVDEFYYKDGEDQVDILVNYIVNETGGGGSLQKDLGSRTSEEDGGVVTFNPDKQKLYYQLTLMLKDGSSVEEVVELKINE